MGTCVNHSEKETSYMCSKHGIYLCEECLECRDPDIYCKFRSACPIWYEHKRKARQARKEAALFLPHTNIDAFPRVKAKKGEHAR